MRLSIARHAPTHETRSKCKEERNKTKPPEKERHTKQDQKKAAIVRKYLIVEIIFFLCGCFAHLLTIISISFASLSILSVSQCNLGFSHAYLLACEVFAIFAWSSTTRCNRWSGRDGSRNRRVRRLQRSSSK